MKLPIRIGLRIWGVRGEIADVLKRAMEARREESAGGKKITWDEAIGIIREVADVAEKVF